MSNQILNIAAAEFMQLKPNALNCNTTTITNKDLNFEVYDLATNAQQLNDLVEKIGMDVYFYDEPRRWRADIELTDIYHEDDSRNKAMLMCAAEYLGVDYVE